jgi:hypothetical protein
MPFDPNNQKEFREILNKLSEAHFLSSEMAINLVHGDRAGRGKDAQKLPTFDLNRTALDRFKKGNRIKNIAGLRELWRVLEAQEDYAYAFPKPGEMQAVTPPEEALASALNRFFSESIEAKPFFDVRKIRGRLAGKYCMYRPAWRLGVPAGLVMTSLVEIADTESGAAVSEVQNFPDVEPYGEYYQKDVGFIFTYGKWVFFLTGGSGGNTSLKLFAISEIMPGDETKRVTYFRGVIYATGHQALFPSAKFLCKRLNENQTVESKHIDPKDAPDREAVAYFTV